MDSPETRVDSPPAPLPRSRSNVVAVLVIGGVAIAAGLIGRQVLTQRANNTVFTPDPHPRPRLNAPFVTSEDVVVDKMIELAELTKDDVVYDLGCGDGRIIITAALQSGCKGTGFDIDPERVGEAQKNVELHDVKQLVTIKEQDIFALDLSKANVAMMYLLPWMMQRLTPQFEKMQPGSKIVSHDFYIEGVEPERVAEVKVGTRQSRHFVFMYTVPLRWNPDMPNKPPQQGIADRADAAQAAAEKSGAKPTTVPPDDDRSKPNTKPGDARLDEVLKSDARE